MSVTSTLRLRRTHTTELVVERTRTEVAFNPWLGLVDDEGPWSRSDARTVLSTGAVGVMILSWAWWEASGSADLDTQTGWLVVGVLGVIVVLKGLISWLRGGWRAVRVRRATVVRAFEASELSGRSVATEADVVDDGALVTVTGSNRYHRRDCLLVRGKPATAMNGRRRLQACEMCTASIDQEDAG